MHINKNGKMKSKKMTFDLLPAYFTHPSKIHGIMHTYRVMHNVNLLAKAQNISEQIRKTAFCSTFIHDMARQHDGYCYHHGQWAVEEKLPLFESNFISYGLTKENLEKLKTAVTYHSLNEELNNSHPHYLVTALLKDADALDRIRLGYPGLNSKYLRLPKSHTIIEIAENNFFLMENIMCTSWQVFSDIIISSEPKKNFLERINFFKR